jgi:hypothetical protein
VRRSSLAAAALLIGFTVGRPAQAEDKPGVVVAGEAETIAVVQAVNQAERTVTLVGPDGNAMVLHVPPEAQNLDQVYAGAKVRVRYVESVALFVSGAGGEPAAADVSAVQLAPKGATPGGTIVRVQQLQARVDEINYDDRTVVLTGPQGKHIKFKVDERVQRLNDVKVGDLVVVRYSEGLSLSMIKE